MLLRNSISKTKKFFRETFGSFKSLLSSGYEKLPKTTPFNPFSCNTNSHQSFRDLDNFYRDLPSRRDSSDLDRVSKGKKKKSPPMSEKQLPIDEEICGGSSLNFGRQQSPAKVRHEEERRTEAVSGQKMRRAHRRYRHNRSNSNGGGKELGSQTSGKSNCCVKEREVQLVVIQKLKELEMIYAGDMELVLDIEEVLHYYSRLTCPAYIDIVNKFLMDMYSEVFLPQPPSASSSNNTFSRSHRF